MYNGISKVNLNITHACNLNCAFCYDRENRNSNKLEGRVLNDTLSFLHSLPNLRTISLIGGEPTLCMDTCKIIAEEFPSKVELITNGIILPELLFGVASITVSFIPDIEIYSKTRDNRFFLPVSNNIAKIPSPMISMVLDKEDFCHLTNLVEILIKMGIKRVSFNNVKGQIFGEEDLQILNTQFKKIAKLPVEFMPLTSGMCGVANKSTIAIDTDGEIYPCVTLIHPPFRLGSVSEGFCGGFYTRFKNHQYLECIECPNKLACRKCIGESFIINGSIFKLPNPTTCSMGALRAENRRN